VGPIVDKLIPRYCKDFGVWAATVTDFWQCWVLVGTKCHALGFSIFRGEMPISNE